MAFRLFAAEIGSAVDDVEGVPFPLSPRFVGA